MIQSVYEGGIRWEYVKRISNAANHPIALSGLLNVKIERVVRFDDPTAIVGNLLTFQAHYLKGC